MSDLVLVRHGQASFLSDDYDQLSGHGREQARRLGEHWLGEHQLFDEVFCGPRVRHLDTAQIVGQCYRQAGRPWPEPVSRPELDEHQVDQMVMRHAESLSNESEQLAERFQAFELATERNQRQRCFQRLFEAVAVQWLQGKCFDIESWPEFQRRVNVVLDDITNSGRRGRKVAVFTSAGPISVTVQRAVACHDHVAMQTGWRLWNCSLNDFVFSPGRFTLDRFNSVPHLSRDEWTYR